jgi:formylglycine-generating enzyme required for sulfatase activity
MMPEQTDQYGSYIDVVIGDVTQRMRCIPGGQFLMGSPKDEAERFEDEEQHEVQLDDFLFGDTAVTQELWVEIMGGNPSYFAGDLDLPVDSVSWHDCQEFIRLLNERFESEGIVFSLPTEEQWEYGCRAGTTTPFSFGDNITTDQVNFDGSYPYKDGAVGEYRKKTVPVKALPCNQWGLYQMHGNVWEWCKDAYKKYVKK